MERRGKTKDLSGIVVDYAEHIYGEKTEELERRKVERPKSVGPIYRDC
jgi:hypothetical protein